MENNSYKAIFYFALALGLVGFCFAYTIKVPPKELVIEKNTPLHSYDRFFLVSGFRAGICLLLLAIPYGMTTSYIAIYGRELGIESGMGLFFSLMAAGLIVSRFFAGRQVDKGHITKIISFGNIVCCIGFLALGSLGKIHAIAPTISTTSFFIIPVFLGLGYGMMFPAYNTLFVNLATHSRRATASSTFLTSWDLGIGIGLVVGGKLADSFGGLPLSYLVGSISALTAVVLFMNIATPHFHKHKLR